jgi:hemolysin activation/secretion protein
MIAVTLVPLLQSMRADALSAAGGADAAHAAPSDPSTQASGSPLTGNIFIQEFRVEGVHSLPRMEIEEAVYPFLGPGRDQKDIEGARAALEKAYYDKGYQTVAVEVPQQQITGGVIHLKVVERVVGRLRVRGAKYSSPKSLKAKAPSISEGSVINFNKVTPDIVALNQLPDRRVTPSLKPGKDPDTVDVDLDVKETIPVHASVELNNRYGPDTDPLRINASVSDTNLWQLGHAASLSYQVSPQDPSQVQVFSGYYLARVPGLDGVNFVLQGTKSNSNVSTLGDVAVAGRGETLGVRANFSLPQGEEFTDSISFGFDYKHYNQTIDLGATGTGNVVTPITYYPLSATYSATWLGKKQTTELNAGVSLDLRNIGGEQAQFANSRYNADGEFLIFHGDITHTRELPLGFQVVGKLQGQLSDQPLISSEEASGGGIGTVRGYLEAEVVGDNAAFGSIELRSPSLLPLVGSKKGEWRLFGFYEGGIVTLNNPLPDQNSRFILASYGVGSRMHLLDHFDGTLNVSFPQYNQSDTKANDVRVGFQAAISY